MLGQLSLACVVMLPHVVKIVSMLDLLSTCIQDSWKVQDYNVDVDLGVFVGF